MVGKMLPLGSRVNHISRIFEIQTIATNKFWIDAARYFHKSGYMEIEDAVLSLAALSQSTRLEAFRTLVRHEPDGLAAGDLARLLAVPQNTLSAHLAILTRARLVTSERHSRSIVYRANLAEFRNIAVFLLRDCCGGRPEVCEPVVESLQACCAPKRKERSRV
jgi:ArsR family transcriptional regulator